MFQELEDPHKCIQHIEELAEDLYINENSYLANSGQPYSQRIPLPMEGHMTRIHQPVFPSLDPAVVGKIVMEGQGVAASREKGDRPIPKSSQSRLVPMGQQIVAGGMAGGGHLVVANSARRLEVLRNCIASIFENKIADAKKTFPAVIRALKGSRQQSRAAKQVR